MDTRAMVGLRWGGLATMGFGLGFVVLLFVPEALEALYALAGPGQDTRMTPTALIGVAIYAGLMVGWGLTLHLAGRGVHIAKAAAAGLVAWWIVDSGASIALGFPLNAVSNLGFLLVFTPLFVAVVKGANQRASEESEKTSASNARSRVSGSL
ncbi:MAG TPA: hypothetical protein PK095_18195 [Myxococcota bacterium]|nr:hypothetical protein [Myxococcota bacterium]